MTFRITISLLGLVLLVLALSWFAAFRRGRKDKRADLAAPEGQATVYRDGAWFFTQWAYRTGRNTVTPAAQ